MNTLLTEPETLDFQPRSVTPRPQSAMARAINLVAFHGSQDEKHFHSASARAALCGLELIRTDVNDGEVQYLVAKGRKAKLARSLPDLDAMFIGEPVAQKGSK